VNDFDVARDDLLLDALAAGRAPGSDDPTVALLAAFRTDLDAAVSPVVVPMRPRKRSATLIALAAAAGLVVGGLTAGAVAVSDKPGELLYSAHEAIVGKPAPTHAEDVTTLLDQASGALARRDLAGARRLLAQASALLPRVTDATARDALATRLALLQSYAVEPTPSPTVRPTRTPEPGDDHGGSSGSGGSDDSPTTSPTSDDHSGSGSSGSGSSGSGSGDTKSPTPSQSSSDSSGHGGGDDGGSSGSSGSGSGSDH
jgi:hypothetical protein